jgi:hypothetical protein
MKNILRFFRKLDKTESPKPAPKTTLFAVYSVSQARIIEEIARRIPDNEHYVFLSFCDDKKINAELEKITLELGIKLIILCQYTNLQKQTDLDYESSSINTRNTPQPLKCDINGSYVNILLQQRAACRQIIKEHNIYTVIVCEDGPGGCAPLIAISKNLDLPVIEIPFGIGEMRDYEMYLNNRATEGTLNLLPDNTLGKFLKSHAHHWILNTKHGALTLFPPDFILARLLSDLDIPKPWVVHGGIADILCMESKGMERIYHREGVNKKKLRMTGSVYADVIYEGIQKTELSQKAYNDCCLINNEEPRILIALPPSYHNEKEGEFNTYQETIYQLLTHIKTIAPKALLTVSLHPAASAETREIVERHANISSEWLLRLIPEHDIFIPTFSSTIRWAIMARKPIVNYDIYRFDLPTYDTVPAVFTTPNLKEAMERLSEILSSPSHYQNYSEEMKKYSDDWGIADGKNFNRVWDTIKGAKTH